MNAYNRQRVIEKTIEWARTEGRPHALVPASLFRLWVAADDLDKKGSSQFTSGEVKDHYRRVLVQRALTWFETCPRANQNERLEALWDAVSEAAK